MNRYGQNKQINTLRHTYTQTQTTQKKAFCSYVIIYFDRERRCDYFLKLAIQVSRTGGWAKSMRLHCSEPIPPDLALT